jgi:carbon-monoxide dehydrogenase medium subunit
MPMLALRVAHAPILVDIGRIEALSGITESSVGLRIGALSRHAEVLDHALTARHAPLLCMALPHVAHPAIRNRGTIGGSLALADPAAEYPACALALDAQMEIAGSAGVRRVPAVEFFRGLYTTAIHEDEVLVAVNIPSVRPGDQVFFDEISRRSGDYALAGLAAVCRADGELRMAYLGCGDRPLRARTAESLMQQALSGLFVPERARWLDALAADLDPASDLQADRDTRLHLAAVLAQRAARSFITLPREVAKP